MVILQEEIRNCDTISVLPEHYLRPTRTVPRHYRGAVKTLRLRYCSNSRQRLRPVGRLSRRSAKHRLALLQKSREGFFGVSAIKHSAEMLHLALHGARDGALRFCLHQLLGDAQ